MEKRKEKMLLLVALLVFCFILMSGRDVHAKKGGRIGLGYLFPRTYTIKDTNLEVDAKNMGMLLFSQLKTKEKSATRISLGIGVTESTVKNCAACEKVSAVQMEAGFSYLFRFGMKESNPSGFYLGPTLSVATFKSAGDKKSVGSLFLGATALYAMEHGQTFFLTFHALPFSESKIKQDAFLSVGITF